MDILKPSYYNLYVSINDEYISLVNLLSGSFDIVKKQIADSLIDNNLDKINEENLNYFIIRNYLTKLHENIEKEKYIETGKKLYDILCKKVEIIIPLTYDCNFFCDYCFFWGKGAKSEVKRKIIDNQNKIFSIIQLEKVFNFIMNNNFDKITINLFGGEPLLEKNKDIIENLLNKINEYNLNNKIFLSIVTNGYNIDYYLFQLKKIIENKIKLGLQITIDGTKTYHNKSRKYKFNNSGSFDKIIYNIDSIYQNNLPIHLNLRTNICEDNFDNIQELYDFYKLKGYFNNKFINIYFAPIYTMDPNMLNNKTTFINNEKIIKLIENEDYEDRLKSLLFSMLLRGGRGIKFEEINENSFFKFSPVTCAACANMFVFDLDYNIYPCEDLITQEDKSIGSYKDNIIFNNEKLMNWRNRTIFNIEKCRNCKYGLVCHGGFCPAHSLSVLNNINNVECNDFPIIFSEYIKFLSNKILRNNENK